MTISAQLSIEGIWNLLREINDPEIPVISIVDLGITRHVEILGEKVIVDITPTYSGCPAMKVIEQDIVSKLKENGIDQVEIKTVYSPVWTTDWLTENAKQRLREYGIAPPEKTSTDKSLLTNKPKIVACPKCRSQHTTLVSQFGSTPCKAIYTCDDCHEPFDYFKCH